MQCKEANLISWNPINLTMIWKGWEVYYKTVNGIPKGNADKIFSLIRNKLKKQEEFIPIHALLLDSVGIYEPYPCPTDDIPKISQDLAILKTCKENIIKSCSLIQTVQEERFQIAQECKEINEKFSKKL